MKKCRLASSKIFTWWSYPNQSKNKTTCKQLFKPLTGGD